MFLKLAVSPRLRLIAGKLFCALCAQVMGTVPIMALNVTPPRYNTGRRSERPQRIESTRMTNLIGSTLIFPFTGLVTDVVERDGCGGHFLIVEPERAGTCWVDVFDGYELAR